MLKKTVPQFILLITSLLVLYFLFWPVGFEPPKFVPEPAPLLEGILESKSGFENVITTQTGLGPEDVAFDKRGRMYSGLQNGQIIRRKAQSNLSENWVNTGGRPLGLAFNNQGDLIVADAKKGLLSINSNKEI